MKKLILNPEHVAILDHTFYRSAGKRFCGDSKEMKELVEAGLMESLGKVSFVPDEYFTITFEGIKALKVATA